MAASAATQLRRLKKVLAAARDSARLAKAADTAGDAAVHFRKVNANMDDIARAFTNTPGLKAQFQAAVRASDSLADQLVDVASASRKGRRTVAGLLDGADDLSRKVNNAVDTLPASRRPGGKARPSGIKKAAAFCGKSSASCARRAGQLAKLGFGLYLIHRLNSLDDDEKACIEMCMPEKKAGEGETQEFRTGPDKEALAAGESTVFCDGTESTGQDWAGCEKYCVEQCTSLSNKCKHLKIPWACDAGSGALGLFGGLLNKIFESLGLGNIKDLIKNIIIGIVIFFIVMIAIFIIRMALKGKQALTPQQEATAQILALAPTPATVA